MTPHSSEQAVICLYDGPQTDMVYRQGAQNGIFEIELIRDDYLTWRIWRLTLTSVCWLKNTQVKVYRTSVYRVYKKITYIMKNIVFHSTAENLLRKSFLTRHYQMWEEAVGRLSLDCNDVIFCWSCN